MVFHVHALESRAFPDLSPSHRTAEAGGTRRAARLMYVAAEVSAHFLQGRISVEPIEWFTTPKHLFGGSSALSACQTGEGVRRALALHGLNLGMDAAPEIVAGIPLEAFVSEAAWPHLMPGRRSRPKVDVEDESGEPALFTATISAEHLHEDVQIFCAMIAMGPPEVRRRLRRRHGVLLEEQATVRLGFDGSEPLACSMVSGAMAQLLILAEAAPHSPLAAGLDFYVEQRFPA
jgi:hypothetical protein